MDQVFVYPLAGGGTFGLFPLFVYCACCCQEHLRQVCVVSVCYQFVWEWACRAVQCLGVQLSEEPPLPPQQ